MKHPITIICTVLLISIFYSCKKQSDPSPTSDQKNVTNRNFYPLKAGNYWIYQQFEIDTFGNATPLNIYDSCYVQKDTIINSRTYYKVFRQNSFQSFDLLRDSLHYIVNFTGHIQFSSQDFTNNLESGYRIFPPSDTIFHYNIKMIERDMPTVTPFGILITSKTQTIFTYYLPLTSKGQKKYLNTRYAENIGIATEILPFFINDTHYHERRLVRYHLN